MLFRSVNCASPLGQAVYGVLLERWPTWLVLMGAAATSALIACYSGKTFRQLEAGQKEGQ